MHNFRGRPAYFQGCVAQRGNWDPTCAKCCRNHPSACYDASSSCLKCGQKGLFNKECTKNMQGNGSRGNRTQSSLVATPNRAAPRSATSRNGGGANCLYAITSGQKQEKSLEVVTDTIKVFNFDVYALLCPRVSLYFVTPYIAINFAIIPEQLLEPYSLFTPVYEVEKVYHDCTISVNHKRSMTVLVELDMICTNFMYVR